MFERHYCMVISHLITSRRRKFTDPNLIDKLLPSSFMGGQTPEVEALLT